MGSWGRSFHQVIIRRLDFQRHNPLSPVKPPYALTAPPPVWRRLFHISACSSIPILAIFVSDALMVTLLAVLSGLALASEGARFRIPTLNRRLLIWLKPLLKETEDKRVTGATYIALSAFFAFLVFDTHVAIAALFFLSLGDPMAAIVGGRMGGFRILGKSPWGSLAFVATALAIGGILSAGGVVSFRWGLAVGAVIAALVELAPLPIDDNVTIPLISGGAMTWMGVSAPD